MSIESQATFYYRNVCDYDNNLGNDIPEQLIDGFSQFSKLLRTIYADWKSYETSTAESVQTKIGIMSDDLEDYHNLTYTLDCLYTMATAGEVLNNGEIYFLSVDKKIFKTLYKKSIIVPFQILEKYGFYINYFKDNNEVSDYKRCNNFHVYFENGADLIPAIKYLSDELSKYDKKVEMPKNMAFMLADYHFIFTGRLNTNLEQKSILNTLGSNSELWKEIVFIMNNKCGLTADLSFNPYVFPNRTVTYKLGKKTICKFIIETDRLNVRLPLSYEAAKKLINKRETLPESINVNINWFGCVSCGKCQNQSNIEMYNGVHLCRLSYSNFVTEDSRILRFVITSKEEIDIILDAISEMILH